MEFREFNHRFAQSSLSKGLDPDCYDLMRDFFGVTLKHIERSSDGEASFGSLAEALFNRPDEVAGHILRTNRPFNGEFANESVYQWLLYSKSLLTARNSEVRDFISTAPGILFHSK